MNASRFSPLPARFLLALTALAFVAAPPLALCAQDVAYNDPQAAPQGDPPSRVARISAMQGNVSIQPATINDFSAAELNYPLTSGDRLYTDNGALSEIEMGNLAARLGPQADFTISALTDQVAQFGLAQGSVVLKTYALDPDTTTEIDTPNASITVLASGVVRVDYFPEDNVTVVRELSGQVHVDADGVHQVLEGVTQVLRITGTNPSTWDSENLPRPDDLDRFSGQRDTFDRQAESSEGSYVPPDMIGAEDLAANGDWENSGDYGAVWYPNNVAADWAPYSNGRWVSIAPWGWTWVGTERWGFAPYHYGRWFRSGNRWGWAPGPPTAHPMYSPALVAFVGGPGFVVGGAGVTAWFPLGPGEAYRPWYHTSPAYVNRVNVGGFHNNHVSPASGSYMNRSVATTAVQMRNFGNGRPVRESAVRVDASQLQTAPVTGRPPVSPQRQAGGGSPARALPPQTARPVMTTHGNENRGPDRNAGQAGRDNHPPSEIARPYSVPQQPAPSGQPARAPIDRQQPAAPGRNMPDRQPQQPAAPVQPARNGPDRTQREQLPETVVSPTPETAPVERHDSGQPRPEPQRPDFQRAQPQRQQPQTSEPQRVEPQRVEPQRQQPQRIEPQREPQQQRVEPQRQPPPQRESTPPPQPRPQAAPAAKPQPQPAHAEDKKKQ